MDVDDINLKKCFIIHLDRASSRKAQVNLLCDILPYDIEVVAAIDAQETNRVLDYSFGSYQQKILSPRYPNALKPSEVACFQSHRKCWKSILAYNVDAAIILEDDISINMPVFRSAVDLALQFIKQGDFVRFPYKRREDLGVELAQRDEMVLRLPQEIGLGMQAQIITRKAAQELLSRTEIFDRPVDCYIQMQWEHKQRVLTIWPSGISEISAEIGGSTINHKSSGLSKLKREIMRPIYRRKISRLSKDNFSQID